MKHSLQIGEDDVKELSPLAVGKNSSTNNNILYKHIMLKVIYTASSYVQIAIHNSHTILLIKLTIRIVNFVRHTIYLIHRMR